MAADKIDRQTVDHMRSWPHSGFSVDNSVYLSSGDTSGLERLAEYILRCPFSLARVIRLTDDGSVIYHAEKDHCGRFPGPASAVFSADRAATSRSSAPWISWPKSPSISQTKASTWCDIMGGTRTRQRGMRAKPRQEGLAENEAESVIAAESGESGHIIIDRSALTAQRSADDGPRAGSVSTWAILIKRVYEVDPLECPQCGGAMKIISFTCLPVGRSSGGSRT